ncbi:tetratricopeptide repeat protein [Allomuricauda sp. SCSIO 65647]|uniref:tetratricopeptide repeat-containing sensor histidine kinase n=1 Tax=Allomuricauda sp. SCSIO 65647 TaxID=2908843 RepID=UPI001F31C42A|nr:tetratricopeptide repeat protein [Muricauda sp. SCSIO 65647]UJH68558.1 tetratricopeptide repeat protein [Muricauda sp. SCSIO 65647]
MNRNLIVFFFLASSFCAAQEPVLDSLKSVLQTQTKKDSIRAKTLLGIAEEMTYSDPENAFPYTDEALEINKSLQWSKGEAMALRQKGNLYYVVADNLNALETYQKALQLSRKIQDKDLENTLLSNIGNIYADLKEYDKALENYNAFLSAARVSKNVPNQIRGLSNIGIVYNDLENFEEGLFYLESALKLAKQEKNQFFQAAIINNLALGYKGMGQYEESLSKYKAAAALAKELGNTYILASALNSIGKVNILLGNYGAASKAGQEALELSREIGAIEWQADSWQVLSTVYEKSDKPLEALNAYKRHIAFRDSVLNEEKRSELTRKEMLFTMEKQRAAAESELKREQLIKNGYLMGAVLLGIIAAIGYLLYKRRRDAKEAQKIADFKAKVSETELKALRSQMNPHFIFNSLNSISDFLAKNDVGQANDYLIKFAKLTRAILENSEKKWIPIAEDLNLMELYMQIESLRLRKKFTYSIDVDETIDQEDTMIPPLILQPFVENSIWHGIAKKEEGGHISIVLKKEDDMVLCVVEDNGVGRPSTVPVSLKKSSLGLKITASRLDIINKLKNTRGSLKMIDKTEGLRVELKLPLEFQF